MDIQTGVALSSMKRRSKTAKVRQSCWYITLFQKKALTGGKYKAVGGYGEVFLEPDYKKKTALDCDLTFLSLMNSTD